MMKSKQLVTGVISALLIVGFLANSTLASPLSEAITAIADRLEAEQINDGDDLGSWPQETVFTGSIVSGIF